MLGLHNILLIAPPPAPPPQQHQQPRAPNISSRQDCNNLNDSSHWRLSKSQAEPKKKDVFLSFEEDESCLKACRDCGNRAKKECEYGRCRTCCKSRGYDCATHLKSTWVPAAKRRERQVAASSGGGGVSTGSSSCGSKRPRIVVSAHNVASTSNASTSNAANASMSFDTGFTHQDARFKESLPGQVRAPAVFRCLRVTAISDGEAEIAYQATVNISGHVFKGFLYNKGIDEKNLFPCISKLHLESSHSERNRDSSSPIVDAPNAYTASKD